MSRFVRRGARKVLSDAEFRDALNAWMASDPQFLPDLEELLTRESKARGFGNLVEAYHRHKVDA